MSSFKDQLEHAQELMGKLKSLVEEKLPDVLSKGYAQLLCDDVTRVLENLIHIGCEVGQTKPESAFSGKKRRRNKNLTDQGMTSEFADSASPLSNMAKSNGITGKNPQEMMEWMVVEKGKTDDGLKWRKYGSKNIKNDKYQRDYYECVEKGCGAKKYMQQSDDGHVAIMYVEDHNCKHRALHNEFGSNRSLMQDGNRSKQNIGPVFNQTQHSQGLLDQIRQESSNRSLMQDGNSQTQQLQGLQDQIQLRHESFNRSLMQDGNSMEQNIGPVFNQTQQLQGLLHQNQVRQEKQQMVPNVTSLLQNVGPVNETLQHLQGEVMSKESDVGLNQIPLQQGNQDDRGFPINEMAQLVLQQGMAQSNGNYLLECPQSHFSSAPVPMNLTTWRGR